MQTPESRTHESLFVDLSARQLRAFVTVAETLSYVETAQRLHYTEPGVFAQIKRLERAIGCRLLVRQGRGLRLTAGGAAILPPCRAVLQGIERIDSIRQRLAQPAQLVVGSGPVTGSYLLPAVIKAFSLAEPLIAVELAIAAGQELVDLLATGKADVVISGTLDRCALPEDLSLEHWFEEPHALYAGEPAGAAPIEAMTIYALSGAAGPLGLLRLRLLELGAGEAQIVTRSSIEAVKGACLAGLGYALLPRRAVQLERQTGLLHEVAGLSDGITGHVWICRYRSERLLPHVQTFLNFLHEFVSPEGQLPPLAGALGSG